MSNDIDGINWPELFKIKAVITKPFTRFIEYLKEWIHGILSLSDEKKNDIHKSERDDSFDDKVYSKYLSEDWFKFGIKRSSCGREKTACQAIFFIMNQRKVCYMIDFYRHIEPVKEEDEKIKKSMIR